MSRRPKTKKPTVVFCELRRPPDEIVNISSQNGAEGVVSRMLPKSHVSHVILNANVSENRFLDMKVSTENKMKKKNMDLHDHFMNTFIKRLERKQQRWMREDTYVSKNFQISAPSKAKAPSEQQPEPKVNLGSLSLPSPPRPPTQLLYKRAKYPYAGVSRLPTKTAVERPTAAKETLPRIHTVPAGTKRSERPYREARSGYPGPVLPTPLAPQQRAESVSTIDTRVTNARSRKRLKTTTNYDKRFTELISWLSPVGPSSGSRLHSRGLLRNFSSVQASY